MKKITIFTQKGGGAKTSLTAILASQLAYFEGKRVLVVDCDFPQFTLGNIRKRELNNAEKNPHITIKEFYPIIPLGNETSSFSSVEDILKNADADFVFFDFTGSLNNLVMSETIGFMDFIFIPFEKERKVLHAGLDTIDFLEKMGIPHEKIAVFWNKVPYQKPTAYIDEIRKYSMALRAQNIYAFSECIYNFPSEFASEVTLYNRPSSIFQSTLLSPNGGGQAKTNFSGFFDEFIQFINYKEK